MKKIKRLLFLSCLITITAICFFASKLISSDNILYAVSYTQSVNADDYVKKINSEVNKPNSNYSLDSYYPFLTENQGDTELCWLFSSSKVLETSLLKQKNEYHNISEAGMALLYYKYKTLPSTTISTDLKRIDISGDFSNFNEVAQDCGIVYENQLSNDVLFDVNENNYENYSYIFDHVDTKLMDNIKSIDFNESETYHNFSAEEKRDFLKKYIMNYGGVFGGLKPGMISSKDIYIYNTFTDSGNEMKISTSHAVCIIGWNDNIDIDYGDKKEKGAFYAINSWGVSNTSFNKIYIPYSYGDILDTVCGYICTDTDSSDTSSNSIELVSSTAGTKVGDEIGFTKKFMSRGINPNNLFVYGEEIELSYHVTGDFEFTNTFVKIYQGQTDVTSSFSVSFYDDERNVVISSDDESKLGECYNIEFYNENHYIGTEEIFIFTGTEVSYIEFSEESDKKIVDSTLFNNNFASAEFSQTYYIYNADPTRRYSLNFYLPDISSLSYNNLYLSSSSVMISITETLEETDNGIVTRTPITRLQNDKEYVSVSIRTYPTYSNYFKIIISDLTRNMMGKTVSLKVPVTSDDESGGTGKVTDYYFHFIISSSTGSMSSNSNRIVYNLDGGKNDLRNINRYPNYVKETVMTDFELYNPEKDGYVFSGWFDVNNVEVTKISNRLSGNVVLYARWEKTEQTYFELDAKISKLVDYYGNEKIYTNETEIVYGDSVFVDLIFMPNMETLKSYQFSTRYSYLFTGNGIVISENGLLPNSDETLQKINSFITGEGNDREIQLVCGTYYIEFDATMVVSHKVVIQKKVKFEYTVVPKVITANYDINSSEFTYDKYNHRPIITSFNGVYEEDGEIAYSLDNSEQFNSGTYDYKVKSIKNSNYKIDANQKVFTMTIKPAELKIVWDVTEKVYNGENQLPDYSLVGIVGNDSVQISFGKTENPSLFFEMKDVGVYNITAKLSNLNYTWSEDEDAVISTEFEITPAEIKIIFNDMSRSFAIALDNLKPTYVITWEIEGTLYDDKSKLNISYYCEAEHTTKSGDYPIVGSYNNSNYNAEIVNGNYKILSSYYIFYTLPDGTEHFEYVEEGHEPVGITSEIYKVPFLSRLVYEEVSELDGASDRVFVNVKVVSYRWIVYFVGVVLALLIFYRISTRRARRNRTR